jgi:DNA-binding transcriptional LysR family regulator
MELYQLKSFICISETGNLTKAAQRHNISQSALSSQIKALEEDLGVELFSRNARGMKLTRPGKKLLAHARTIINESLNMEIYAKSLIGETMDALRIGLNTDPVFLRMNKMNQILKAELSGIQIQYIPASSMKSRDMLREESIDIGFIYGIYADPDIEFTSLSRVPGCVVIPVQFLIDHQSPDWKEIVRLPWIWAEVDCPFHAAFQHEFDKYGITPNQATYAVDEKIVLELVKDGQGLAVMRPDEAKPLEEKGEVIVWDKCQVKVPLNLACLKQKKKERSISEAIHSIRKIWGVTK